MKQHVKIVRRAKNSTIANRLINAVKDRQPDMTELMLNDIDDFGIACTTTAELPNHCTFRLTKRKDSKGHTTFGGYFKTDANKDGSRGTVQLSEAAKTRLTNLTGGKVEYIKRKDSKGNFIKHSTGKCKMFVKQDSLYSGAFSMQDFRRCFDYIKKHSDWVDVDIVNDEKTDETDTYELYIVDSEACIKSLRVKGTRWDNLAYTKTKINDRPTIASKKIGFRVPGKDKPVWDSDTKKFDCGKRNAVAYYNKVLKHIGTQLSNADVKVTIKVNGETLNWENK